MKGVSDLKIICCDNEKSQLKIFSEEFSDLFSEHQLLLYTSPCDILKEIKENGAADIILMDIDLDEQKTGMDYAEEIYRLSPKTGIIYVTAYADKFIHDIFLKRVNTFGFLVKPASRKYLEELLLKAENENKKAEGKIPLFIRGSIVTVNENDILYVESDKHLVRIITENGQHISHEKLSEFSEKLSDCFGMPHKSFIVNMNKIKELNRDRVILINGKNLPISRSRTQSFKKLYLDFLKNDFI